MKNSREPLDTLIPLDCVAHSDQILAAQRGDSVALGDVLDGLLPFVGRICGSIALDAGPDATQDTMIQVMRDLRGLRDPVALKPWVRRIATREAIRHAKRGRREPPIEHAERTVEASKPDPTLANDVKRILSELSWDQRVILVLRDLEGMSESEVAAELEIAQGTVKSRLHRARQAFRMRWEQ